MTDDNQRYPAPDAYGPDLEKRRSADAKLRLASMTPEQAFEDGWKFRRLEDLAVEYVAHDEHAAANPELRVLMTADELNAYAAPNSYEIALRKDGR